MAEQEIVMTLADVDLKNATVVFQGNSAAVGQSETEQVDFAFPAEAPPLVRVIHGNIRQGVPSATLIGVDANIICLVQLAPPAENILWEDGMSMGQRQQNPTAKAAACTRGFSIPLILRTDRAQIRVFFPPVDSNATPVATVELNLLCKVVEW